MLPADSRPPLHDSARMQVTGRAKFVDDIVEPRGCLHAYPVFSQVAKGKVTAIDTAKAEACDGFVRLIRISDVPGKTNFGAVLPDEPLLSENKIDYHSQPIMLIVAESHNQARRAAAEVRLRYDLSKPVLNLQQAITQNEVLQPPLTFARGDVDSDLAVAPNRLSGTLATGGQEHFYMEGQISLAIPTEDGGFFISSSTQNPSEVQHQVADALNLPFNKITIETRRLGGGFGGKETQSSQWAVLAALASYHTGKAVKLRLARADDFRTTGKRHPFYSEYQIGFDDNGRLVGCDIQLHGFGGYATDLTDAIVDRAMLHADNAYYYPSVRIQGHRWRGNKASNTAFRGFGGPQGMIVAESIMDDIARFLEKDPLQVRVANLYQPGRDITPYQQRITQFVLPAMIEQLASSKHYDERRQHIRSFNTQSPIIKRGLSLNPVKFGISFTAPHMNQAGALLHIYTDGSIHLNHGGTEMGQGLNTKVAQIVAHAFAVDLTTVAISATRTDKVPNTSPTAASSGSDLNGMAALNAANTIKHRLVNFIAEHFDCPAESVSFSNNHVYFNNESMSFRELIRQAYMARISLSATGFYATPKIHFDRNLGCGHPFFYYSHGVALTEVEIDTLTGENCVVATDILFDVGNSINPALDTGQIEGAFIQGMGWLTTEELTWNSTGELISTGPATYKIPAIGDTPAHFNVELFNSANPEPTVFHSKAIGEPPFMLANSVWCALRDAISSLAEYRYCAPLDPPATPERILNAVLQTSHWQRNANHGRG